MQIYFDVFFRTVTVTRAKSTTTTNNHSAIYQYIKQPNDYTKRIV